jgi:hypothetical protein
MGLPQHTHEMTWRCVAIVGFDAAVCHSSPFFRQSPFRQMRQPQIQVELFDELVAAMRGDCLKKGDEWHTAGLMRCSFVKSLQDGFTSTHA